FFSIYHPRYIYEKNKFVFKWKIHEYLRTNLLNLFDFKPHHEVKQLLQRELHALSDPFFKTVYRAYFPWNRAFEIGISYD
ncbi:MAG TPA: hypothetical protein PLO88_05545, partial [Bacilli bacterium]|nr:hypothetical protein [Bacilli bacterium]